MSQTPQFEVAVPQIAPSAIAEEVTPSDSTTYTKVRSLWVGGAGDVVVTMSGADVTFAAVPAGTLLPIVVTKVKAASTATAMVLLF